MIGLDSNILLRFLTRDDEVQSPKAARILARLTEDRPGFISLVTLVEVAWTLRSFYRHSYQDIGRMLGEIARSPVIKLESEQEAFMAIKSAEQDGAELADVLIAALGRKAGCSVTMTFDESASRLPGFQLAQ